MDFFGSFTPQDWVTFALAALAFLVSAGSLVQNHFFRPRPHFTITWYEYAMDQGGVVVTFCRYWNDGDATARNVRVTVEADGVICNAPHWEHWDEFPPGKRHGFEVPLEPAEFGPVAVDKMAIMPVNGGGAAATYERRQVLRPVVKIR